jgi:hypothetical protein
MNESKARLAGIFGVACGVGVMSGMFGVGGGIILIPLLVLVFHFEQHKAQGTSLMALVPPTGILAFIEYWRAGDVDWTVGLLLMPGVFLGGYAGGKLAQRLTPKRMRQVFAGLLFALGAWQAIATWVLGRAR